MAISYKNRFVDDMDIVSSTGTTTVTGELTVDGKAIDSIELSHLDGVTSNIQTQLDAKAEQATTYTKTEVDAAITNSTPSFTTLTGKPTTISGYGITDAQSVNAWAVKTSAYTAVASDRILADTSAGTWTLTLPATASVGDTVIISDYASSFGSNPLTVARNGLNILGLADNLSLDMVNSTTTLIYSGATKGWILG